MQEKLIIYLAAQDTSPPSWVLVNAEGMVTEAIMEGDPALLASLHHHREVIVLIPHEDVLLTKVAMPKMNRSRLQQALPYALEEQVIDEIDVLHFAAGDYQADNLLPVAVTSKEKMQRWINWLKEWHIKPDILTSVLFVLPLSERTWHIALRQDQAWVRISAYEGFIADRMNLPYLLSIALKEHMPPNSFHIHNYASTPIHSSFDTVLIQEDKLGEEDFFRHLSGILNQPFINLLQGTYATKRSRKWQQGMLWKGMVVLLSIGLSVLFLYPTISYFILHHRVNLIEEEITAIYKRHFPHSTSLVAPKQRMEERMRKLSSNAGQNRALILMSEVGKALSPAIKLKRLDYQNNQLTLTLTAGSSEVLSVFTEQLQKQGLMVQQQNANLAGGVVSATLQVE